MTVYEERQRKQALRDAYRDKARELFPMTSVDMHANVQVMDSGAFVEAIVWVPKEKLDETPEVPK